MIYFCILAHCSTHIIALVLISLFFLKGSAPFFPLFYYATLKTYPAALLTDSETDNQSKQCTEWHNEKEFTTDHKNASSVTAIMLIASVKNSNHQTFYSPTHFLPVATPPPNQLSFIQHFP